jgi:hypothetical protein
MPANRDSDFPRGGVTEQRKEVGSGADHKNAGAEPRAAAGEANAR